MVFVVPPSVALMFCFYVFRKFFRRLCKFRKFFRNLCKFRKVLLTFVFLYFLGRGGLGGYLKIYLLEAIRDGAPDWNRTSDID